MDGAHDADHLTPRPAIVEREALADGARARPELRRGEIVDDGDAGRVGGVAIVEQASRDQAEPDRLKVVRRRGSPVGVRHIAAARHDL